MNNKEYWQKRAEEIAGDQFAKVDDYKLRMELEYLAAIKSVQKDIQYFYMKFAQNNQISYVEALRLLKSNELEEFKMDLAEFTRKARNNKNEEWEKELNNVSYKVRITRLEALQTSINNSIENLFVKQEGNVTNLLKDIYEDTYHRNIFEIQKGTGVGTTFAKADDVALDKVISERWQGSNYSERIWKDRDKLVEELKTNLSQSFIRGDSIDKTTKLIANRLDVDKRRARTLVNTESAYIAQKATFDGYESTGAKQYQILATLDLHTSTLCRGLDGKIFDLDKKEIGVTAPPFHPNCRTTTVAYFEGMMFGERIARDSDGKVYYVDRNMNYKEWYDKYVKGNPEEEIAENKIKNKAVDKKQYEEYKNILGNEVPKSFDKFQDLKYNDTNEWNELKTVFKDVNWQTKAQGNTVKGSEHTVPFKAEPNSVFDNYKDGKLESRRYYGKTGKPRLDIDLTDHGNSKEHTVVPHYHDWFELKDEKIKRDSKHDNQLTEAHKIANKDILKGDD